MKLFNSIVEAPEFNGCSFFVLGAPATSFSAFSVEAFPSPVVVFQATGCSFCCRSAPTTSILVCLLKLFISPVEAIFATGCSILRCRLQLLSRAAMGRRRGHGEEPRPWNGNVAPRGTRTTQETGVEGRPGSMEFAARTVARKEWIQALGRG